MIVGLDMGGTHIDGVIIADGQVVHSVKKPTNPTDLFTSIWSALAELLTDIDKTAIQRIHLSTTISTNAIVEDKTARVGMFIQSGPGLNHDFLACGNENIFIRGYVDHRGKVVESIHPVEIEKGIEVFKEQELEAYGIVSKFSTRNPTHELAVKELLEKETTDSITMGHTMSGKLNFPRRVFTTYLNAAVSKTFHDFATHIKKSLAKEGITAPLYILKADGGTMNIQTAEKKPVETILSGPAASFSGMNGILPTTEDAVLLDIGGTTTDIFFLADGVPLFEPLGIKIDQYKTLVRSVYSVSLGLGGDSAIEVKDGQLKIGPQRAGYPLALGGPKPTPTDAMIVLGLWDAGDHQKAKEGMANIAHEINLSVTETAEKILEEMAEMIQDKITALLAEINSQPVFTIEELLEGKVVSPKRIHLIGGPAQVLAPILEEKTKLPTYYPKNYQIANAIGAALAKTTTELTLLADTGRGTLSVPELGMYEEIPASYHLAQAKKDALALLEKSALAMGADANNLEMEIIEENSFNMVDGFLSKGKNIRVKAQVKPGLNQKLRGVD